MVFKLIALHMKSTVKRLKTCGGFGIAEILGIAAVLIVAAFVLIPGFRTFTQSILTAMTTWFTGTVQSQLFPTS